MQYHGLYAIAHILFYRSALDLRTHLWVIEKLLVTLEMPTYKPYEDFMLYTIATCHHKMFRRFQHPWSGLYYKSLDALKEIHFTDTPCEILPEHKAQYANDHDFLTGLANISRNNPEWNLPLLIPKLIVISQTLPNRGSPLLYYTSDTCTEFHRFLCLLLKQFHIHLRELHILTEPPHNATTQLPIGLPDIQLSVDRIFVTGYTLWKMARGRAFEIHMRNIQNLLLNPRTSKSSSTSSPGSNPQADCNEEVESTVPFSRPVALWKPYRDWVLLMVVHFEAVSKLQNYFRSAYYDHQPINISILLGTEVNNDFLEVDKLFSSDFFPGDAVENKALGDFIEKGISLKKQHAYCLSAVTLWKDKMATVDFSSASAHRVELQLPPANPRTILYIALVGHITSMQRADPTGRHEDFISKTKTLVYGWLHHHEVVGQKPKPQTKTKTKTKKHGTETNLAATNKMPLAELVASISESLTGMAESLSQELLDYGLIANLQLKFEGTLHCETCLAALLDPLTRQRLKDKTEFQAVIKATEVGYSFHIFLSTAPHFEQKFGHVIGVSKRSCPVCHHFLSLLSLDDPFVT